jgi:hypothetical protein
MNKETWQEMVSLNAELEDLRQLYNTITHKLNIACDQDGRNRVLPGGLSVRLPPATPLDVTNEADSSSDHRSGCAS